VLLGVDVGGTFTDAVLVGEGSSLYTAKVPSTPAEQSRAVLEAVRLVLARAGAQPQQVERFAHGMTVATNALLEGNTARTALIATEGFTDVLELGRQTRAHLYRLCETCAPPLVPAELRFAARERVGPHATLRALDRGHARELAQRVLAARSQAVAVCLLHAYADPAHERLLGEEIAALAPDVALSLSSELVGTFREFERTATTVLDAALSPLLSRYLRELCLQACALALPEPQVMQSSGGLTDAARAGSHAALTVLSGPAGGVAGASLLASLAGEPRVLCLDMGGTSCDVCVIDGGEVRETAERVIGERPLALPALDIHTVGAGGGSIAWRDAGGALRVGPASAGALPGPACYGRGGERPTVTDANLLLGRLLEDSPLAGGVRLQRAAAERAVARLAGELDLGVLECAEGIVRVAEAEMLGALRVMTLERGVDPRDFALMPFGGAGPLHAVALAEELAIARVLCPRASGVLCALGLAAAAPRVDVSHSVLVRGESLSGTRLQQERSRLVEEARAQLALVPARVRVRHELRYAGQSFELAVDEELADPSDAAAGLSVGELREAFHAAHEQRYGYCERGAEIELVTVRASAWGAAPALAPAAPVGGWQRREQGSIVFAGHAHDAEILRGEPAPGESLRGPALCVMPDATLLLPPGWRGEVDAFGSVMLARAPEVLERSPREHRQGSPALDPIELRLLTGALRAACEEMAVTLVRSAHSSNIKERRDCSTALFDSDGQMVMQAEAIPVHLGAMPAAVAAVLGERHAPGVSWILNDPFAGGTHLPDITVITPSFAGSRLIGFAVSRAHHADVGARVPGSMPADSASLAEEGVVISPCVLDEHSLQALTTSMRQPRERRADLRAQLAANRVGATRLSELAARHGAAGLRRASDAVLDYCERRTRACLAELEDGEHVARDVLEAREGDLVLRLRAVLSGEQLLLDFSGSAPQHEGNLNCPLAVTRSACLFALRVLTDPDIPPTAGAYRPLELIVPHGSVLNALPGAAVAAGNVETSSRVADLVLSAFGHAQGQGTMNNLTLGNERFTYYETLGGGQGACADADGPSGVHVAMSNTLNTPIEALEREFPLHVARYELRRGSGGEGRHRGGDGVVREVRALEEMSFSLIAERRRHAPAGADGGAPGACGRDLLDGHPLPGKATGTLARGQSLRIETPGGGGFGDGGH